MKPSRGAAALLAVAAWLSATALLATLGPYARVTALRGDTRLPEETPGMSAAGVSQFLEVIGEDGRTTYVRAQWLDLFIPLLTVVAAAAVLSWTRTRLGMSDGLLAALMVAPLLLACSEVLENVSLGLSGLHYPGPLSLPQVRSGATTAKFVLYAATVLTMIGNAVVAFVRTRAGSRIAPRTR